MPSHRYHTCTGPPFHADVQGGRQGLADSYTASRSSHTDVLKAEPIQNCNDTHIITIAYALINTERERERAREREREIYAVV